MALSTASECLNSYGRRNAVRCHFDNIRNTLRPHVLLFKSILFFSQEKQRLVRQLENVQASMADMKATMVTTSADKERFFHENIELQQQLQNKTYEIERLGTVSSIVVQKS